jgi:hypothetical protein
LTAEAPPLGGLEARRPFPVRLGPKGNLVYKLVTTTDHKTIGIMYVVTCFAFFFIGGLMALLMRAELATPGLQFLSNEQFNQLFTMHGTIMLLLLLYATPIVAGWTPRSRAAWAITDWNYLGRGRRHHDHHLCADPDSLYAGRCFLPRQRQLEVWTQIGFGIVNEFVGLLGGEPISAPDGVGALQRRGR